jgi:hypothetical protein
MQIVTNSYILKLMFRYIVLLHTGRLIIDENVSDKSWYVKFKMFKLFKFS